MVEANLKIIRELKYFLNSVTEESELRKLVTFSKADFTRDRKLPMKSVIGLIINLLKRSLSVELNEFFKELYPKTEPATKSAFSIQRMKLNPVFFEAWNKYLVQLFYHYYGNHIKRWKGFRLQAVDGSTAYLMNKEEIINHFGTQANQFVRTPIGRVMQVQDVLNDITVWGGIFPVKETEQSIISRYVSQLSVDSLTIFDRAYPSFSFMYLLINEEQTRHFVIRCSTKYNKEVRAFMKSRKKDQIIEVNATKEGIARLKEYGYIVTSKTTIRIRMVKIQLESGETEVLLTNLNDKKEYTINDLYYLYGLRWKIETTYNKQKNQLQMEQFSGHTVVSIQQDYAAGIFISNLQSLIEKQCDDYLKQVNEKRKYNYKINRNVSWASMKHNIVKLFLFKNPKEILLFLQKEFERNIEPVRLGRHNPRSRKIKRMRGKYQTYTNYKRVV